MGGYYFYFSSIVEESDVDQDTILPTKETGLSIEAINVDRFFQKIKLQTRVLEEKAFWFISGNKTYIIRSEIC